MSPEAWAVSIACCSVVCCMVELLTVNVRLERTVRFVLGAFVLCVLILPLKGVVSELSQITVSVPDTPPFAEDISAQREELLRQEISVLVSKTLKENDIVPVNVSIDMDIDDDSCISIITAEVTLKHSDSYKANRVKNILDSNLSIKAKTLVE